MKRHLPKLVVACLMSASFGLVLGCGGGVTEGTAPAEYSAPPTEEPEIRTESMGKPPGR